MKLSDFDFELETELIAQTPLEGRSDSRLLHLDGSGSLAHRRFLDLVDLLTPGDLLVGNNTRVLPVRLSGRVESGRRIELLVLPSEGAASEPSAPAKDSPDSLPSGLLFWSLARPAKKLKVGSRVFVDDPSGEVSMEVIEEGAQGRRLFRAGLGSGESLPDWLERIGTTPLPLYIGSRQTESISRQRYQTIYAKQAGAVAAPTAGLHFTVELLQTLAERGIGWEELTLHVGYGTFQPIRSERVEEHRMAVERYDIPPRLAERIDATRRDGGRIVAVGTTVVRALESAGRSGRIETGSNETDLFIRPGFEFKVVDGLVTNFHLPRSSLLILVSALGGVEEVRRAYQSAIARRYRFYSYGDAMLIYPAPNGATTS